MKNKGFTPLKIYVSNGVQKNRKKSLTGFTLIEVLLAIFIIAIGGLGAFALLQQTLTFSTLPAEKLIASYLAQEGIEIVRNIRDTNWLEGKVWDTGLGEGDWQGDYFDQSLTDSYNPNDFLKIDGNGLYSYNPSAPLSPCHPYGDVNYDGVITEDDATLILAHWVGSISLTPDQQERADVSGAGGVQPYDAVLILRYLKCSIDTFPVCDNGSKSYPSPTKFKRKITIAPDGLDILKVTVEVSWQERGRSHRVTAQENLYNWK